MLLSPQKRGDIQKRFAKLTSERSDPEMLELTYFSDKSIILKKLAGSEDYASHLPDKCYIDQLTEITFLRNTVAHTGNTSDNDDILQKFIDRLRIAHKWMIRVSQ